MIVTKRVYEEANPNDGYRVLVDRLWPRGLSKDAAHLDEWLKDIAPSTDLRKWFNHQDEKFEEFTVRYKLELQDKTDLLQYLKSKSQDQRLTLLYATKNVQHNHTVVLLQILQDL